MKRILAWVLLLVMVLGMFAGCKNTEDPTPTTDPATTAPQGSGIQGPGAQDAIDYLKSLYQDDGTETPVDYNRYGIVRVGGIEFKIEWSVDVAEDLVKIVVNEDGTVTVDINEQCQEATPYVLTATITDENGNVATYSWNHILPKAQDMVEIVKAAYALAVGESLTYESRLIGKIISIDSIWSDEYQNITVTIEITGAEDMPIKCYRMKGNDNTITVIKDLKVGNIITVLGTLKNYEGTIEFDAGCILEKVEKGDAIDAPTDPGEILKAAYALKQDEALPYQATLTGTVTEIDSPYDPNYGNISVVIEVEGYEQYPILCYRLKGTGVDEIAINDLITVTGIIKNYKGTIEYDAGCMMTERVSGGGVAQKPSSDAAKILADAAKLGVGEKLPYIATLTGEIVSVDNAYDPNYGNVTVTIKVNGVKIQCYRMVGDGIDQIRETDTITVTGVIENYNGKLEFGAKCNLDSWTKGPRNVNYGSVKEDVAYRLYMDQKATGNTVYFNGEVSSNRLQTTTTGSKGVDVYAERHSKGLRFYYMDGNTKTYIEIEEYTNDSGQQRGGLRVTTEPSCYWVYNSDCGVYIVNLPTAGKYFLGTYGTYETISASWIGYIDGSYSGGSTQYVAKFIEASKVQDEEPSDTIVQGTAVENPAVGTAYKFGYYQNQLDGKPFLAFSGKMAGWYYGTADAIANMVDVYLEEAEGGYHIYFMDGNAKTYLDVVPRDTDATKVNTVLQTSGAHTVWQLNLEHKYVYTTAVGSEWYLGTFGTNNTISASLTSYISDTSLIGVSQFCAWFSEVEEVEAPDPEPTDPQPSEPSGNATLITQPVYATAYKLGMQMPDGTIMYLTGDTSDVTYRLAVSANASEAADFYLEEVPGQNGGAYLYFMDGNTKTYVRVYHRTDGDPGYGKGSLELVTSAPSEFFGWSAEANTLIYDYDGNNAYYVGTYEYQGSIHDDASVSNTSYITGNNASKIDVTQFPIHFYTVEDGEDPEPSDPQPTDPTGIVTISEALAAANGTTVTVKGVVTLVDSSNIYVQDSTGAICVRMSSAPNDISVGDTIIGTGSRADYNGLPQLGSGTYEKSSGMTLSAKETTIGALTTADICTYVKISGLTVTEVFDNNGSYTQPNITVEDSEGNSIQIYKAVVGKTGGAWDVKVGDVITVNAAVGYFNKFQLRNTVATEIVVGGEVEPEPTDPEETDPQPSEPIVPGDGYNKVTSAADFTSGKYVMIVSTGYAPGVYDNGWLSAVQPTVSGNTVTDPAGGVWTLTVNGSSVTITDANGVTVKPKGGANNGISEGTYEWAWSFENGTFEFAGVGSDTVLLASNTSTDAKYGGFNRFRGYKTTTISGAPSSYPCQFTLYKLGGEIGEEPEVTDPQPTDPQPSEPAGGSAEMVTNPVAGQAYKWYVEQGNLGKTLYFAGSTANKEYFLSTTEDINAATDVYLEETNGGYYLYFMDGNSKTYIDLYLNGTYQNIRLVAQPSVVYTYNTEYNTLVAPVEGTDCYIGTYNTFDTFSCSKLSYAATSFPSHFAVIGEGSDPEPSDPQPTEPQPTEPAGGSAEMVTDPVAGQAYKWYVEQGNLGKTLYFAGSTANKEYFLSTTEDINAATDVYLEETNGGYYLYFMDGNSKTYIDLYLNGTYQNIRLVAQPSVVYTYNTEYNTLVAPVEGTDCYIGTYNTFDTFSCSKLSYAATSFPSHFAAIGEGSDPQPSAPEESEPEESTPSAGSTATYTFSNYTGAAQYEDVTRQLDDVVSVSVTQCHFTTQLRIYQDAKYDGKAFFTCTKAFQSLVINAGHKDATLNVLGSNDGVNYTLIQAVATTSSYGDYVIELPAGTTYKYLMLDAVDAQIRVKYITFNFAE